MLRIRQFLTMAGLTQGVAWSHGEALYRVLPQISIYMILRAALGLFILTGSLLGFYNVVMTLARGEPIKAAVAAEEVTP